MSLPTRFRITAMALATALGGSAAVTGDDDGPLVELRHPLPADSWHAQSAYFDLDPSAGVHHDYRCLPASYDGHEGTDFAILDFVEQDEGRWVLAAADGVVVRTQDGYFDRETSDGIPEHSNSIGINHEDGSQTQYHHLKKWSVRVHPGQRVREGQPIAMVGSSGKSAGPHLHFAVRRDGVFVDPHSGPCGPAESLWRDQKPHVVDRRFGLVYFGTSDVAPGGGRDRERPPDVHHVFQEGPVRHFAWAKLVYAHVGDTITVTYLRPDGEVHDEHTKTFASLHGFSSWVWNTILPASGHTGSWTVEVRLNGELTESKSFVFDTVPYQEPVAVGRTVGVPRGFAHGELRGWDADSGIKTFRLVSPPSHGVVELHGPRQRVFSYHPDSGYEGGDSFAFVAEDAHGQLSPAATMTLDVAPIVANAVRLEDEGDGITIPDNGTLRPQTAMTVEAWIRRRTGGSSGETIVDRRYAGDDRSGFVLSIDHLSRVRFRLGDGTAYAEAQSTQRVPLAQWVHVAGVWDGTEIRVSINGQLEPDSRPFAGPIHYPGSHHTSIGRDALGGAGLRADVDEIRIWSEARTAGELREGSRCAWLAGAPPKSLLARWPFEGSASDVSSYGNHGTVAAPASFVTTATALPDHCAGLDTDGDGLDDDVDNCPFAPNADQADTDADGWGDACDLCPGVPDSGWWDSDEDGWGDACDACPFVADTEQLDADSDGAGDLCDAEPGEPTSGTPSDDIVLLISHDRQTSLTDLTWTEEPLSVGYEVYRGDLDDVQDHFYGVCQNGRDPDTTDTSFGESESPHPGQLFAYLVVGVGSGGQKGLAGLDSSGRQRDLRGRDCL